MTFWINSRRPAELKPPYKISARQVPAGLMVSLIIFSLFLYFISFNFSLHIHTLPDGRVIFHSHPIPAGDDKNDNSSHSHTNAEFTLFNAAGSALSKIIITADSVLIILCSTVIAILHFNYISFQCENRYRILGRAPPSI